MKAFSPKARLETPQANQALRRPTAREAAASRASGFVDNRPEATAQRKLQAMMYQSPQVQRQAQLQARIDNSPRVRAQVPLQAVLQRTVLLPAGTSDIDKGDLVVYNMIDYAVSKVGGPIVSAWDNPTLKHLQQTEELFIVEHGRPGIFDNPEKNLVEPSMEKKVIEALINPERGLPQGFKGTIHVTACWAGVGVDQTPSVVTQIQNALTKAGFTGVTVLGAKGPTTGYQVGLVPRAVKPEYKAQAMNPPPELGRISTLRGEMEDWLDDHKGVDIAKAARKARKLTGVYVPKYVQWLETNGYLFEETEGFHQVQT